jgi:hypothetical protein
MKRKLSLLVVIGVAWLTVFALAVAAQSNDSGQGTAESNPQGPIEVSLFGGGSFPGGHLKYTYSITRQGSDLASTTTTEITPLADGSYSVVSTSTETESLDMVHVGFFGVALPRLGIHVAENTSGTIDLSPLSNISSSEIEPGKSYLLPDGGRFEAGELGTIAGIQVVYGTYTQADYTNVEIDLAFPVDLTIRSLLPFPALMEFRYSETSTTTENQPFEMFSSVELSEFVYTPLGDQ